MLMTRQTLTRLKFADDGAPGITRKAMRGRKWAYFDTEGARIKDREEIDRLNAIAMPPAYERCWFSADPDVHLLATGYDARGRKQYRYHPDWRLSREAMKFDRCVLFGEALPVLRARVDADIASRRLTRERAIASVVALLDTGAIRVGNECYARTNKSFGATTLRKRHAKIERGTLLLRFRGKSGKQQEIACDDPALVRCVRKMQDLPGQHLFRYVDEDGAAVPVHSHDVNEYLAETMGEGFTAKHFRTWAASTMAFTMLVANPGLSLKAMLDEVAQCLGNTPAIARKSYVHPAVIAAAKGEVATPRSLPRKTRWMTREERGLLAFLESA
ncbi:DNA topoisomerase IB [Novosphingobium guangzhouense]|uniref:DNA topoisomerase n=1 Tax=Novosphingobium guangzhouense TaxID=1850347 RepID=A0A2K2FT20_9SPHN|nr:DNA topoisomerase IB [Novosphingobium guangzhouense]PNU01935.1 DNA topoisomerase [Novosphingobium guangzhouense]